MKVYPHFTNIPFECLLISGMTSYANCTEKFLKCDLYLLPNFKYLHVVMQPFKLACELIMEYRRLAP